VIAAAVHVYAHAGWSGFTFDAVASEAGVGKPAIYRRWSSSEELLIDALDRLRFPTAQDCGSLRADLLDYAAQFAEWYSDRDRAMAALRLHPDRLAGASLGELYDKVIGRPRSEAAREITRRAIKRGEIGPQLRSSTVAELLLGAMMTHWMLTSDAQLPKFRATIQAHAEDLVDIILAGIEVVAPPSPGMA
jgi:AcrR family transcriptional regulator